MDFMKAKQDAATYISAVVHMDEKTPHMHLIFVPLTPDNRLSAKTIVGNKKKLTQWQDEFHAHMVKKYPNFERGEAANATGRVHLPPRQYKAAVHLTEQRTAIMEKIRSVNVFNMKTLLPEIMADIDKHIRGTEGFKTQLVKVARKNKDLEAEIASDGAAIGIRNTECPAGIAGETAAFGAGGEGTQASKYPAGDH